jgi:hypothetical protein
MKKLEHYCVKSVGPFSRCGKLSSLVGLARLLLALGSAGLAVPANADVITVNTTNNLDFSAGETNLWLAIEMANTNGAASNTINFDIPGSGPFYIATPPNGYPLITNHDITIDGYSQPLSAPNSHHIHEPNNAQIMIVLDSRIDPNSTNVLGTSMDYTHGTDSHAGFTPGTFGILGLYRATNFTASGLCFLGAYQYQQVWTLICVAVACDEGGTSFNCHISGCWFGVDLDGTSVNGGCQQAIANYAHQDQAQTNQISSDNTTIGVAANSTNPPAEFNVILGMEESIGIEGNGARVSGNFLGVYPSGLKDWIGPRDGDPNLALNGFGWGDCHIEFGLAVNNTVFGSDLDGVNDADEGNVMGGVVDETLWPAATGLPAGYGHSIEFYGYNNTINGTNYGPGSAIIANNYCGVGIDGKTLFTNGVPFSDGNPTTLRIEGNVIFNNYPTNIFDPSLALTLTPSQYGFYDGISPNNIASARKNTMVNNYPYPANAGAANYISLYNKALLFTPVLASDVTPDLTNATTATLQGTVPVANETNWSTEVDAYIADPEGMANGKLAGDTNEPYGWVQGLTYLGTFPLSDVGVGAFDFDISSLELPVGTVVTVTANYVSTSTNGTLTSPFSNPLALAQAPQAFEITSVSRAGTNTTINWIGGTGPFTLQRLSTLTGAWANVQTNLTGSSTTFPDAGAQAYYRIAGNTSAAAAFDIKNPRKR